MPSGIPSRLTEALRTLGLTPDEYYIGSSPPIWGIALQRDGKDVAVIEHTPRAHDYTQDGRYHVRLVRSKVMEGKDKQFAPLRSPSLHSHKRQRDAIAAFLSRQYGIS
jgi:hypothetical protein